MTASICEAGTRENPEVGTRETVVLGVGASQETTGGSGAAQPQREVFLDAVRTMAIIRVVLWHTLGAAVLTYFVAAVPAMFFVTGSLLAKSLRRGARRVIIDRARRILLPLWLFALAAYVAMAVAHLFDGTSKTALPWRDVLFWLLPLNDPHGSAWEGGYMSSPLWYLRALLWLILLSPLLLRLVRRSVWLAFGLPLAALAVLEVLNRTGAWPVTNSWAWRVGDLALYGIFLMLGFMHRDGRLNVMTRRRWSIAALTLGAAAAVWCTTQPVPEHVVNNSHVAHLLVGGAWLSALFVARPFIERLASSRRGAAFIGWVNKRTITIYLWHSTAVIVSFELLRSMAPSLFPGGWSAALLAMTAGVTLVFVLAFGWMEDVANRRRRRLWPGSPVAWARGRWTPRPIAAVAVFGTLILVAAADQTAFSGALMLAASRTEAAGAGTTVPSGNAAGSASSATAGSGAGPVAATTTTAKTATLRIPSQQPKAPTFTPSTTSSSASSSASNASTSASDSAAGRTGNSTTASSATTPTSASTPSTTTTSTGNGSSSTSGVSANVDPTVAARLDDALRQWMAANNVPGAEVAIYRPGFIDWATAQGVDPTAGNQTVTVDTRFDIASVTKTFTMTLIWQLADQGKIDVDAPIGQLAAVPDFPYTNLTVRQLLSHTSGLVNFRETPEFAADPNSIDTPQKALLAAGRQPLEFAPGSQSKYSTTNYLVLGFLLEQITGRTFDQLVAGLTAQAGIGDIPHAAPTAGYPNFSIAGLEPTATQLAHWGVALLGENTPGLSEAARQAMADINPTSSLGAGLWGYCPCTTSADGQPQWAAIGHTGSNTELQYSPDSNIAIVMNVTDSAWAPDNRQDQLIALAVQLRAIALGTG